ncbi:MAG: acetoacetate--CoA ligase [Bacteroidota bacterium]
MEEKVLWTPTDDFKNKSNLSNYIGWLEKSNQLELTNYEQLREWSVKELESFWLSILEYFNIEFSGDTKRVLSGSQMPHFKWFPDVHLSYSEHIFKNENKTYPAIIYKTERSELCELSWAELRKQVSAVREYLKVNAGVKKGDRVVGYLTNTPESVISFLAVNSLGAVWSSCSPDFGVSSIIDRFSQIEPKAVVAVNGYHYGGKYFDKTETVEEVIKSLPTAETVLMINNGHSEIKSNFDSWEDVIVQYPNELEFERVNFNDPIWILYSSGTTGKPKAITHSQGGILLEHYKYLSFHNNIKKGDRCFWYTTTGWMMWNYIQSSLLLGATLVMYDGSPAWPEIDGLWELADQAKITHLGTSAGYIVAGLKANLVPKKKHDLTNLVSIGSTGSPLPPEGFDWIYETINKDIWLTSISGGTDVCSAFVGGNPLQSVVSGEIQCRALGCDLQAFNEVGSSVENEVGEMVITRPMPSMPIYFWNDTDFSKYRSSYFDMFKDIWRHGDWIQITKRGGIKIFGRSDATLNRGGVRIGTSEIYRAVDKIDEVEDSLIICVESNTGEFYMPLFVKLKEGQRLTQALVSKINSTIRNDYSPRHVPDELISAPDIPYTISGKKTETPVKKIFMGKPLEKAMNKGALKNPESMNFFVKQAKKFR